MKIRDGLLLLSIATATLFGLPNAAESRSAEELLALHALQLSQYHETVTGVLYPTQMPVFRFVSTSQLGFGTHAIYDNAEMEILVGDKYRHCNLERMLDVPLEALIELDDGCDLQRLRESVSHELGHYLTHVYLMRFAPNSWLADYYMSRKALPNAGDDLGPGLISEGVAVYIGCLVGRCPHTKMAPSAWSREYEQEEFVSSSMVRFWQYQGGYDVAESIFEARGVEAGLRWMFENPLHAKPPDIDRIRSYKMRGSFQVYDEVNRRRVLGDLLPEVEFSRFETALAALSGYTDSVILALRELQQLRRQNLGESEGQMRAAHLDDWAYLIKYQANLYGLSKVSKYHVVPIVSQFKAGRVPTTWIRYLTDKRWMYAMLYARQDAQFHVLDGEGYRSELLTLLGHREHISRIASSHTDVVDYNELPESIGAIENVTLLSLIKRFVDYADSHQGQAEISRLFAEGDGAIEQGGVFMFTSTGLRLVTVRNDLAVGADNAYQPPIVHGYMRVFGSIHTHPVEEGVSHLTLAGPSGYATKYFADAGSDMNVLRYYLRMGNPYMIHVVATKLPDGYNLDIYFRDLEPVPGKPGYVHHKPHLSVLDVGNYRLAAE